MRSWFRTTVLGCALASAVGCAQGGEEPPDPEEGRVSPDVALTSGGATGASGETHALVYVAPVRPVGELESPRFRLRLGPAAARSGR